MTLCGLLTLDRFTAASHAVIVGILVRGTLGAPGYNTATAGGVSASQAHVLGARAQVLDAKGQQIESARVHVTELRAYLYTFAAMQSA